MERPVGVARWFAGYSICLAAACVLMALVVRQHPEPFHAMWAAAGQFFHGFKLSDGFLSGFQAASPGAKLLFMGIFLSLCTTFLPLPTGPLVTLVAIRGGGRQRELCDDRPAGGRRGVCGLHYREPERLPLVPAAPSAQARGQGPPDADVRGGLAMVRAARS